MENIIVQNQNDEISLYDLFRIISKRKYLFWSIFVIILVVGIATSFLKPKNYSYTQVLQIANYSDNSGQVVSFESSKTVIAKIKTIYLPTIIANYNLKHPDQTISLTENSLTLTDMDSGNISLVVKGRLQNQNAYAVIFKGILAQVAKGADPLLKHKQRYLTNYLAGLQKQIAAQNKANAVLLATVMSHLKNSKADNNDIVKYMSAGQLAVGADQSIANLNAELVKTQGILFTMQKTSFTSDLIRSEQPVGVSKTVLVILSLFIAFVFSFMMVFIAEFFARMRALSIAESGKER